VPYVVTVELRDDLPPPSEEDEEAGWSEADYAARDAVLEQLGVVLGRRRRVSNG
jgi:hypothetical protein